MVFFLCVTKKILKFVVYMIKDLKVSLAQIATKTGDIKGNSASIIDCVKRAIEDKSDLVVFPETAITGYCCGSLFNQPFFVKENLDSLNEIAKFVPKELHAFIGYVDLKWIRKDGFPEISNSVCIINDGKIIYSYDKQFMANGNHHEDKKYFLPGSRTTVCDIIVRGKKITVGTPICEDVWSQDHVRNIPFEMKSLGAELLVVCNQSYFTHNKDVVRHEMYSNHANSLDIPIIQVNSCGVGDIVKNFILFDGDSGTYLPSHGMFKENIAKSFTLNKFSTEFVTIKLNQFNRKPQHSKYKEIWDALVFAQREIFKEIGVKNAQVHLSGGLDSAIVAPIVATAMGKDHTIFISNPTDCNSNETKGYAQYIADKLGIKLYWNTFQDIATSLEKSFSDGISKDINPMVKSTFHAVGRTAQGLAACHHFKSAIVATGNFVENILNWSTFHDIGSVGVMSLIGDLTKVEVYQFAKWINDVQYKDIIIPEALFNGQFKPAAELPDNNGKGDPFDYWVVSGICEDLVRSRKSKYQIIEEFKNKKLNIEYYPKDFENISIYDRINLDSFSKEVERCVNLMRISVFKTAQSAPNILLNNRSRGFSNRETLLNKYIY